MRYSKNIFEHNTKLAEDIIKKSYSKDIKTITMGFPDIYGRFMGKKFDIDYFNSGIIKKGSNACNYLLGCDIEMNPLPNSLLSSYSLGYGDFTMIPDLYSKRKVNYLNNELQYFFFSDLIDIEDNTIVGYAPRQLLRQSEEKLELKMKVECEINFTAFNERYRKSIKNINIMEPITDHSNLSNVFYSQSNELLISTLLEKLQYSSIPVASIYGDDGYGQFKVCLEKTDLIEMCDNITLLKLISKKIADDFNMSFTYMAKYSEEFAGNNLNLKISLLDNNNKPVSNEINDSFVAGILKYITDFSTIYLPNVNSYKRLFEDRIIKNLDIIGNSSSLKPINIIKENDVQKISFNLSGADANPYLVLYALIESGKLGLKDKLNSNNISNELKTNKIKFPTSLYKANKIFSNSEFAKNTLGKSYHNHYSAFFNFEYQNYNNQVSEWELNRYLYSI